jgi:hypothetical protein
MTDQDDLTTPFGLFNFAHSYWRSAQALQKAKVKATHSAAPVEFLYIHAIEVYLKSLLRLRGLSVAELRSRKYGHGVSALAQEAENLGMWFADEDKEVVALIASMDLTDLRYIKTGPFTRPAHEALDRTCKSFDETVGDALIKAGHPIRRDL